VLNLGSEGRMNTPGRLGGNWGWRYTEDMLTVDLAARLRSLTEIYGRLNQVKPSETSIMSSEL
jgi:4-alpha-glucanotransferase